MQVTGAGRLTMGRIMRREWRINYAFLQTIEVKLLHSFESDERLSRQISKAMLERQ